MNHIQQRLQTRTITRSLFLAVLLGLALALASCSVITPTPVEVAENEVALATFTPTATLSPTETPTPPPTNTPTPTPLPTDTPTPVPTAMPAPTRQALKPAATPTPGKVTLVMKEADLNKMAQDAIAQQSDVSITNVRVDLRPGKIIFSGRTVLGFFPVDLETTATLPVVNGRPEPKIVGVKLNGAESDGFIRAQVVNMIQPYLEQFAQTDLNLYVEKIVITDDEILITGRYQ